MEKKEEQKKPKKGLRLFTRIKAWRRWLHRRQQQPVAIPEWDETEHECPHCHYTFKGRQCPQCGTPAEWKRFTFKRLFHGFMDIWGLGNRPMFRSMLDLLWRPGYMIRDYLNGHHLSYFPPFKMLAIMLVLTAFFTWLFDIEVEPPILDQKHLEAIEKRVTGIAIPDMAKQFFDILAKNRLYRVLLMNVVLVFVVWLVFRKRGLNLVETFFSQIYINCQMQLVAIIGLLLFQTIEPSYILPYPAPFYIMTALLVYDFHQLYGVSILKALWKFILIELMMGTIFILAIIAFTIIFLAIGGGLKEIMETS